MCFIQLLLVVPEIFSNSAIFGNQPLSSRLGFLPSFIDLTSIATFLFHPCNFSLHKSLFRLVLHNPILILLNILLTLLQISTFQINFISLFLQSFFILIYLLLLFFSDVISRSHFLVFSSQLVQLIA
jgi:hypothetical protein